MRYLHSILGILFLCYKIKSRVYTKFLFHVYSLFSTTDRTKF